MIWERTPPMTVLRSLWAGRIPTDAIFGSTTKNLQISGLGCGSLGFRVYGSRYDPKP